MFQVKHENCDAKNNGAISKNPENTIPIVKHGSGSIMLLGRISVG